MNRVAYLAQPIDHGMIAMKDGPLRLMDCLRALGWVIYSPADAWTVDLDTEPGTEIEVINRTALESAGLVVAFLPDTGWSVGVPREIENAVMRGVPTCVVTPRRGWALADVPVFETADDAAGWLPTPHQAARLLTQHPLCDNVLRFYLADGATLPTRTHEGDAGWDLYSSHDLLIHPGTFTDVPTGVYAALPARTWARITGRSSTLRRWGLLASEGVIDSGYRGELYSGVWNLTGAAIHVPAGTRLTQLILHHNLAPQFTIEQVDEAAFHRLPGDGRGSAGFGSTGQ